MGRRSAISHLHKALNVGCNFMNTSKTFIILFVSTLCLIFLTFSSCKQKNNEDNIYDIILDNNNGIEDSFANYMFEKGLYYVNHNEYQKAKDCFLKSDKAYPNTPVILNAVGNMVARTEDISNASPYFEKALRIDSNYIRTYINYGASLNGAKRYEEAEFFLWLGLNKNPKYGIDRRSLYANLAVTYYALNQKSMSFALLDSAKNGLSEGDFYDKIILMEQQLKSGQVPDN